MTYTNTCTSNPLLNIYYLLLVRVSATECDHLQGDTNFIDVQRIFHVVTLI